MSKLATWLKKSYIVLILGIFYIPVVFAAIYSFNDYDPSAKGNIDVTKWVGTSLNSYSSIVEHGRSDALINSIILGSIVAIIVAFLSLFTNYALWRQRNKAYKVFVDGTSNIPLINPDVITAVSLSLIFGVMFGSLTFETDGMWRAIIAHVTMILPFGIVLSYPRSAKFKLSLIEASKDLGFGPLKTWFKTYFIYMLPMTIAVIAISMTMSFDDFILTRTVSNTTTIGTKLYEGSFKGWALAFGTILMFATVTGSAIFALIKRRKYA